MARNPSGKKSQWQKRGLQAIATLAIAYLVTLLVLFLQQRQLIYRPQPTLATRPSDPEFQMPYEEVRIPVGSFAGSQAPEHLQGWWIPAIAPPEQYVVLPDEPIQVLSSPRVILYHCGAGNNRGDRNYIARIAALRQLGFSVLIFDYRGYGNSEGSFPHEAQLYQDSQAAWSYLTQTRRIPAQQIVIYGESLGGAIALALAIQQPEAGGVILQSTFTSMTEVVQQKTWAAVIPVDWILTERFDSLRRIRSLQMPVLLLHGQADPIIPFAMSQQLYNAAPEPKALQLIPGGGHVAIYQPGAASYLKAIHRFVGHLD
ncbi:MAG: alpha/beta hydrolase [Synechococcales bacterium]|nr:alpha/beta hydrolase [Synechococcales bacterium]